MSGKSQDIYNKGCDYEIEALFIRNWDKLKQLLYLHKVFKISKVSEFTLASFRPKKG
jgi:hypothetical protein